MGAPGYDKVRIMSILNGQTVGSSEAAVDAQGKYSLRLMVPFGQPAGPTRLCAAAIGASNAELACTNFIVDAMPTSQLQGQISGLGGGALNIQANLVDRWGRQRYSVPVNASGNFQLGGIDPGVYRTVITGQTSVLVNPGNVVVPPGYQADIGLTAQDLSPVVRCVFAPRTTAYLKLKTDLNPAGSGGGGDGRKVVMWSKMSFLDDNAALLQKLSTEMLANSQRDYFGVYVSGVSRLVDFLAFPQTAASVDKVVFSLVDVNGQIVQTHEEFQAPYEARLDMRQLSPQPG